MPMEGSGIIEFVEALQLPQVSIKHTRDFLMDSEYAKGSLSPYLYLP